MDGHLKEEQSDSTVQTVDEMALEYYREDSVLKPVSARAHTDDWPCFLLTGATVFHKDGTLANLLHVDLEGPLIVRGKLEIEKDQEKFLINRHMKDRSPYIQLQDTVSFSIGLKEDKPPMPVLWASGGAGWYEIVPSDSYKDICNIMFQGISLHYAILDQYEAVLESLHRTKKNRNKTLRDVKLDLNHVLIKYAVNVGDGITSAEAKQRINDQAIFLLSHFPKDTEFYRMLAQECPNIVQRLAAKESNEAKAATSSEPSTLVAVPYRDQQRSSSLEGTNSKKRGRPSLRNSTSRHLQDAEATNHQFAETIEAASRIAVQPTVVKQELPANAEFRPVDESSNMGAASSRPKYNRPREYHNAEKQADARASEELSAAAETDIPRPLLHKDESSGADIRSGIDPSLSVVLEVLRDFRESLLALPPHERTKTPDQLSPSTWCNKLYRDLSVKKPRALAEVCKYYAKDLLRLLGPEWYPSKFYKWLKANVDSVPSFEDLPEEQMRNIHKRRKKGQPRETRQSYTSSPSYTSPAPSWSHLSHANRPSLNQSSYELPTAMDYQQPEEKAQGAQPPHRVRTSGKVAGLRPSIGGKKRLLRDPNLGDDEMELDDDGLQKKVSKKSRYSASDGEHDGEQGATASSGNEYNAEDEDAFATGVVGSSTKPSKPNRDGVIEAWKCEERGCSYVVQVEDEDDADALIMHHYELHHKDARHKKYTSKRVEIQSIIREESRIAGGAPINFLLKKVGRHTALLEDLAKTEYQVTLEVERQSRRKVRLQAQETQLQSQEKQLQYQDTELDVGDVPEPKERDTLQ
ncbi:uncharacterized protein F4812DRAFT_433664 [Daldinia caldariorum]|uniref:uncharacterized protein n=1 Tax=Daldinia caldariorum TaxID=326644 RepID=UPI002007F672|nr:uncharacterized protein F4812DRAFT_433664 [Daldinia caldariorum]KAI1466322.1 hypothetical protein F4812DRAFT_433664 [Daldinia caldariorum]